MIGPIADDAGGGTSPVHRLPPGLKVAALAVCGTALFLVDEPVILAAALAATVAFYRVARLPARTLLDQLRSIAWLLVLFFAVQWWLAGLEAAAAVALRFATLILLAGLVTATTRVSAMLEAIEKGLAPLARIGVDPRRVGLALTLALRFLPLLQTIAQEVRDAQAARGAERSMRALVLPTVIRALKLADETADALDARGFGADRDPR